ncbi:MAG: aspartate ammonia-lyase [Ruminococcaceae bacterium]|nr:aspartate ammonia-lyase [Oscillospiraceae bacterium]
MTMFREERDSIGAMNVPVDAYYGVQSLRAKENFKITGQMMHAELIKALMELKIASAQANADAGVFGEDIKDAIVQAGYEVLDGKFWDNFIVDAIQGGAGTSANMNANEVLANRAIEILGGAKGDYSIVHPNDHVNCGQSTNDVYPSAGRIAIIRLLAKAVTELERLAAAFDDCADRFKTVITMGRTEMQDAVPISLGRSFGAFASAVRRDIKRFATAAETLSTINMGGTAIGTGINADKQYIKKIADYVSKVTGLDMKQAGDLVDATQNADELVYVSGIIKSCAVSLSKISNDLRLMSSGPRCGFGEINLPPRQNGSSIMPGKVNPVMPEMLSQVAYRVIGNDLTVTASAEGGQLELNAFEPVMFHSIFESLDILRNGVSCFIDYCVSGITANEEHCKQSVYNSIGIVTALCPYIGYTESSKIAKIAAKENKRVYDVIIEQGIMTQEKLDELLEQVIADAQ